MSQQQRGPQSEAGLVQYYDVEESDMLFISYKTILSATLLFATFIAVLNLLF